MVGCLIFKFIFGVIGFKKGDSITKKNIETGIHLMLFVSKIKEIVSYRDRTTCI